MVRGLQREIPHAKGFIVLAASVIRGARRMVRDRLGQVQKGEVAGPQ